MFGKYNNVRLRGIAATVPKNKICNRNFTKYFDEKHINKQIKATGIESRYCSTGESAADMCYNSASKLMSELKLSKEEIKVIIFVSSYPSYNTPSTAFYIQNKLDIKNTDCLTFDINLACSGFVVGIETISAVMQNYPEGSKALLLVGGTASASIDKNDRTVSMLFGDGGAAAIFEKENGYEVLYSQKSDGTRYNELLKESYVDSLRMDGMAVFNFAISDVVKSIEEIFEYYNIKIDDIDCFGIHQAQKFIVDKIIDFCRMPKEKVVISYNEFGNTSCVSVPIALCCNKERIDTSKKKRWFICGFGAGLSWGSIIIDVKNVMILPIMYYE